MARSGAREQVSELTHGRPLAGCYSNRRATHVSGGARVTFERISVGVSVTPK